MFKSINITMGMSVGQSPIASFLTNLANLEHRKKELKGELSYFYEDVEMLASHPYAVMVGGKESMTWEEKFIVKMHTSYQVDDCRGRPGFV